MVVPFVNFLWTDTFRERFEKAILAWGQSDGGILVWMNRLTHAANGLALAIAWGILMVSIERGRKISSSLPAVRDEATSPLQSVETSLTY